VALKLLNNNLEVELRGVSQCLNLKHPNLVTIFDIRQDADQDYWIVMEYVGGRGLYDVLRDHPSGLPVSEVLSWLSGISAGLSFLHDRGIVHRDLKPANVFFESGIVKIGDVGLSKFISESRRSAQTQSVGTVYYMAPEVARGRYGREVDVYALGVMLVEMLTGHVPFDGETTAEILMKHMMADPDLSGVPQSLHQVLLQALEKDPQKRIADVEELERRFRAALAGEELPAPVLRGAQTDGTVFTTAVLPEATQSVDLRNNRPRAAEGRAPAVPVQITATASPLQQLKQFWRDELPKPIRWILTGIAVLLCIRLLRMGWSPSWMEILILLAAFAGWRHFTRGNHSAHRPNAGGAARSLPDSALTPDAGRLKDNQVSAAPSPPPVRPTSLPQATGTTRNYTPATARQIPATQRMTDITSSLSMTLLAVGLVTAAIHLTTQQLPELVHVVYFAAITLLASWALIIPSKLWEGRPGDGTLRRLALGMLGMGIGLIAAELREVLLLSDHSLLQVGQGGFGNGVPIGRIHVTSSNGMPTTAGFMVFFGILFTGRRWWWQIDSFRKSRFRISSSLLTLLIGAVLAAALPFPGALGMTWALAISAVVQLCAGWTPHEDRRLVAAPAMVMPAPVVADVQHPMVPPRVKTGKA
jgi:serine/threonine protein kinase